MDADGTPVAGSLDEMLGQAEVVIDCTPNGVAAKNKERYQTARTPSDIGVIRSERSSALSRSGARLSVGFRLAEESLRHAPCQAFAAQLPLNRL